MHRYVVGRKRRKHLVVEPAMHEIVVLYAKRNGWNIVEATYKLLMEGLLSDKEFSTVLMRVHSQRRKPPNRSIRYPDSTEEQ